MTTRTGNKPWKGANGTDRAYTARVERAVERGEFTEPGTQPNVADPDKIKRKRSQRVVARGTIRGIVPAASGQAHLQVNSGRPEDNPAKPRADESSETTG